MHNDVDIRRQLGYQIRISYISFDQPIIAVLTMRSDVLLFDRPRVKRIEVIDDGHPVAVSEEPIDEVTADEAGTSGNEDVHYACGVRRLTSRRSGAKPRMISLRRSSNRRSSDGGFEARRCPLRRSGPWNAPSPCRRSTRRRSMRIGGVLGTR